MDIQSSTSPPSPIVKPLLLDSLGKSLLAYVLGASEDEVEEWLVGESESFGTERQTHALEQLLIVLNSTPDSDQPMLRRLNLAQILGLYQEAFNATLVNAVRMIATNETPSAVSGTASLEELLKALVHDMYPLYLLPEGSDPFPTSPASLYRHPLRERFEAAIMADEQLAKIFSDENQHMGRHGSVLRSTGQGGGVQLSMFAETLISGGWRVAEMATTTTPSAKEHVQATLEQLQTIRSALAGEIVRVPVRIAFTGVLLSSAELLDLGWGTLRPVDERDRHLVPPGIKGGLSGTRADGSSVVIDYSGDVVLETTIEYRLLMRDLDLTDEWPIEVQAYQQIGRLIESVQLGALLSEEYNPTEPITVLPTWHYVHDPLAQGYNLSWNDPRMSRGFVPKRLDKEEAIRWVQFASAVELHRTKYIDVAIRRTLRASSERRDFVDVLVDTVIAWENLVGSQKGEPTLRVSGSLAWLLEDDITARSALRSELTKLYRLRSQIVHGNQVPSGQELVTKSQRAMELTVKILRRLFTERLDLLQECNSGDDRSNRLLMGG